MNPRFGFLNLWALRRKGTEDTYLKLGGVPFIEAKGTSNVLGTKSRDVTWKLFDNMVKGYEENFPKENYECVEVSLFVQAVTVDLSSQNDGDGRESDGEGGGEDRDK